MLVFAAAVKTAQYQEKIDDIGIGTGPARLQLDFIDFELAQLQLRFGQIRGLARNSASARPQQLFLFGMQVEIFVDALRNRGFQEGGFVNFVQKIIQLAVDGSQEV
jgi:hypothetical protein